LLPGIDDADPLDPTDGRASLALSRLHLDQRVVGDRDDRDRPGGLVKLIGFAGRPALARCEIAAFRYRVLHVAARITRGARTVQLRIDRTWRWATAIATVCHRIRAAFA
jgi:hypothetical protein